MKVYAKGDAEVSLTAHDFVAEGGEGKVFARGDTGYKIYHEPAKAIPLGKIKDLSAIRDPNVIAPLVPIYSGATPVHVGHTFRFVKDTWTLCQLFPKAFREREGFSHVRALALVQKIQKGVDAIHKSGVLLVDLNEMNFLVSRDFKTPLFIDVDSYQTPNYPATAIMASVRDWHTKIGEFTEGSDWFSFAVVSFQLFVGIHPYKGKHPSLKSLEERMVGNVSVFDPSVSVPRVCYPLDVIPEGYRQWYRGTFQNGRREHPPADPQAVVSVMPKAQIFNGGDKVEITDLTRSTATIRVFAHSHDTQVVHAGDLVEVNARRLPMTFSGAIHVGFTPRHNHPIVAQVTNNALDLFDATDNACLVCSMRCDEISSYAGRLYARNRDKIYEIEFSEAGDHVRVGANLVVNVLEHASRLFQGVVLQNLLGKPHASLLPRSGASYQIYLPELVGHRVLEAKLDGTVLMVLANTGPTYTRFVYRFRETFDSYDVRKVEDVGITALNFVTLDSGTCVCLDEQDRLEVFSSRTLSAAMRIVEDPALSGITLSKLDNTVIFHRGNQLCSMRLR